MWRLLSLFATCCGNVITKLRSTCTGDQCQISVHQGQINVRRGQTYTKVSRALATTVRCLSTMSYHVRLPRLLRNNAARRQSCFPQNCRRASRSVSTWRLRQLTANSNKYLELFENVFVSDVRCTLDFYKDDFTVFGYEISDVIVRRLHKNKYRNTSSLSVEHSSAIVCTNCT